VVTADYRVVPGDRLTYSQAVDVKLTGDLMKANLTVTGAAEVANGFVDGTVTTTPVVIKGAESAVAVANPISVSGKYIASTTFVFNSATTAQASTNATINYSAIGYKLEQIAPTAP
jgi:alternate signal-mediated exported protein